MHAKSGSFVLAALAMGVALAQSAHGADKLKQDETKALLSGNTVSATHHAKGYSFTMFMAPDGTARQVTSKGDKAEGTWLVRSDGDLCVNFRDEVCGPLIPLGDGRYKRMSHNPRNMLAADVHIVTFEKVEPGNPGGL